MLSNFKILYFLRILHKVYFFKLHAIFIFYQFKDKVVHGHAPPTIA